jgi:hypothetical protein
MVRALSNGRKPAYLTKIPQSARSPWVLYFFLEVGTT